LKPSFDDALEGALDGNREKDGSFVAETLVAFPKDDGGKEGTS
jgi:hypothetical protein